MSLPAQGLYRPENEHDACGVGFVANIKGRKSHTIVEQGLTVLKNLTHRGAVGWDPKLSDGAGLLIQVPDRFFREEMAKQGVKLPKAGQYGVGMVFLPRDPASRIACEYEIERAIKDEGQTLLGWRDVPVDNSDLAEPAKKLEPVIRQVFIARGRGVTVTDALERKLYIIRKSSGHAIQALTQNRTAAEIVGVNVRRASTPHSGKRRATRPFPLRYLVDASVQYPEHLVRRPVRGRRKNGGRPKAAKPSASPIEPVRLHPPTARRPAMPQGPGATCASPRRPPGSRGRPACRRAYSRHRCSSRTSRRCLPGRNGGT